MKKHLISFLLLVIYMQTAYAGLIPTKPRDIQLKEFTNKAIFLFPDLSVTLVFPFVLDSPKHKPAFKIELSNDAFFSYGAGNNPAKLLEAIAGQNTLTITVRKPKGAGSDFFVNHKILGSLVISVDGYNINLLLRTTATLKKHYSTIRFIPDKKQRKFMVEKEVAYTLKAQNDAFREKMKSIDNIAQQKALSHVGALVLYDPITKNIKEEKELLLDNSEYIKIYLDKFYDYKKYIMLLIEINNLSSRDINIESISMSAIYSGDKVSNSILSTFICNGLIKSGEMKKCVITTQDRRILETEELTINFATNQGNLNLKW